MTDKLSHRVLVGGQRQIVTASPGADKAEREDDCPGTRRRLSQTLRRGNGVGESGVLPSKRTKCSLPTPAGFKSFEMTLEASAALASQESSSRQVKDI